MNGEPTKEMLEQIKKEIKEIDRKSEKEQEDFFKRLNEKPKQNHGKHR